MLNRILSFYTKYFALWVFLFGVIAYFCPAPFERVATYNKYFFALTMFGIGAVLNVEDFKRIAQRPSIVLVGSSAQFLIMPFGAFILARLFHLSPELTVGLVLTGSAPGAMASNVMCYIAGADTAYSVSLTTVSTLLCPILTPGLTKLLAGSEMKVGFLSLFVDIMMTVILPLWVGFVVKYMFRKKMDKVVKIFPAISVTFIIFICSVVIAKNREYLSLMTGSLLVLVLILNVYGMVMGYGVGAAFKMASKMRRTLCIEVGMQNAGLGTVLALAHFGPKAAIPSASFVFVCIITSAIMAEVWRRRN